MGAAGPDFTIEREVRPALDCATVTRGIGRSDCRLAWGGDDQSLAKATDE